MTPPRGSHSSRGCCTASLHRQPHSRLAARWALASIQAVNPVQSASRTNLHEDNKILSDAAYSRMPYERLTLGGTKCICGLTTLKNSLFG